MEAQQPPTPPPPPPPPQAAESVEWSPRSRNTESWEEALPGASSKLRLMCSYGGHIVPRPHDKSLCYVGGDTRMVVVERSSSLSELSTRLSRTFLNGRAFTLKYQLPSEDLDSLISVTTDEDLDNMIDEYDRTNSNSSLKPSRIRLFLFPSKLDSTHSIPPPILDSSAKSDDWFLNALNGAGLLNRGFSDSASVNCLLGLEDDDVSGNNLEPARDLGSSQPNGKNSKQDVHSHSVPDSPMLETTSSFGSTSSSPSLANLPPIRVHVEEGKLVHHDHKVLGIEEQFAQIGAGVGHKVQDEGFVALSSPPLPANRVLSDDEGHRKPPAPQPQPQPQFQHKSTGSADLPSPDSVSSDTSISNAMSRPKPVIYQEQVQIQSGTTRAPSNPADPKLNASDRVQMQQHVQDPGYLLQQQFDQQHQQQFMQGGAHFIHHTPAGAVPISAYYPVYPSQPQQQQQPQQVYYVPARQPPPYNLAESATTMPSSRNQTPPNPAAAYNPIRNKTEMTAAGYRTATTGTPQLVHVPASQHQQQYAAYSQIHHPSHSIAPASAAPANYAYDYADPAHAQIYYSQPLPPSMPSQYQTMTAAAAQHPSDTIKQQIRTSQPL